MIQIVTIYMLIELRTQTLIYLINNVYNYIQIVKLQL